MYRTWHLLCWKNKWIIQQINSGSLFTVKGRLVQYYLCFWRNVQLMWHCITKVSRNCVQWHGWQVCLQSQERWATQEVDCIAWLLIDTVCIQLVRIRYEKRLLGLSLNKLILYESLLYLELITLIIPDNHSIHNPCTFDFYTESEIIRE